MTNREWLLKEMQNMSDEEVIKHFSCDEMEGAICRKGVRCSVCKIEWLKAEHKEKPKLSEAERVILENIDEEYKWICRDKNSALCVYKSEPEKGIGNWNNSEGDWLSLTVFTHLFQFIKWEDENPYNIEELLKGE
jgi:ferredoxin